MIKWDIFLSEFYRDLGKKGVLGLQISLSRPRLSNFEGDNINVDEWINIFFKKRKFPLFSEHTSYY